ncbi:hypothetical protein GCM10027203_33120 [Nonomuraea fastidiosa]
MTPAFVAARTIAHDLVSSTQLSLALAWVTSPRLGRGGASVDVMAPNGISSDSSPQLTSRDEHLT